MPLTIKIENIDQKNEIIAFLKNRTYPDGLNKEQKKRFRAKVSSFCLVNDILCFNKPDGSKLRAVFDFERELIQLILIEEHRDGHPGMNKMVDLIHRKYYGISSNLINDFVRSCDACSSNNSLNTLQDVHINNITRKYDRYIMDCVDLRRYSDFNDGYSWILNVIDTYTKYLFSYKLKNKTAQSVQDSLSSLYMNFGIPKSIQSDNGKEFSNTLLREFHNNLNIQIIHGRPRNPRAQGQVERVNQTLKRWLSKSLAGLTEKRWIDHHERVVFKYNITKHRATSKSPFLLFHNQAGFNIVAEPQSEENDTFMETNQENDNEEWVFEEFFEESDEDNEINLRDQVLTHFSEYRQSLIYNSNSNNPRRRLTIGNFVKLQIDFDNNTASRRNPLDPFYEPENYEVIEILTNNMIKIKNCETGEIKNVFKNRLKKITIRN